MKRSFLILALLGMATPAIPKPVYNAGSAIQLAGVYVAWNNETPATGSGTTAASQQVQINTSGPNKTFFVDGHFAGDPGVFEVDVQVASNDADTDYQTCANCNITTVDASNFTFHLDGTLVNTRFVRLLMRARTNSVAITARIGQ
jgi:phosphate-selective porin